MPRPRSAENGPDARAQPADGAAGTRAQRREQMRRRMVETRLKRGLDSYGLLLALVVAGYVFISLMPDSGWARVVVDLWFVSVMCLSMLASGTKARTVRIIAVLGALAVVLAVVEAILHEGPRAGTFGYLALALCIVTPVVIVRRVLAHPQVTIDTILGAIAAYVMLGIAFAAMYLAINSALDQPFFTQGPQHPGSYLYFSLTVLTTVGFGDLTSPDPFARSVIMLEALTGQIFLVTLVARLVSAWQARPKPEGRTPKHESPASPGALGATGQPDDDGP